MSATPSDSEPHKTTEPAATNEVAAGSTFFFMPCQRQGIRAPKEPGSHSAGLQPRATFFFMPCQRQGIRAPKEPGIQMVGTGTEQTRFHSRNRRVASGCDAKCDAISADRIELLARAVVLVAGMNLAEAERAAVLGRVIADLTNPTTRIPE